MSRIGNFAAFIVAMTVLAGAPVLVWERQAYAEDETAAGKAAMNALDEFMKHFNARDDVAWAKTLNYPHVRVASGDVRVWQDVDEYAAYMDFDAFIERTGWHHSVWDKREIVQSGDDKVHIAVQFTRYDENDKKIATYESLYIVTNVDGHWGTQARSSFAP